MPALGGRPLTLGNKYYRQQGCKRAMTLHALEFIPCFAMHILPKGLVRIRHYGILAGSVRAYALRLMFRQFGPRVR